MADSRTSIHAAQTTHEIEELLTCPICLDTIHSPKVLLCFHSLCCVCLKQYVTSNGYKQHVPCPSCRVLTTLPDPGGAAAVDSLPTNFLLNSLIGVMAPRPPEGAMGRSVPACLDGIVCEGCLHEKGYVPAAMRCVDCAEFMCDGCVKMHKRNKKSQLDHLITVEEYLRIRNEENERWFVDCSSHPKAAVDAFCSSCNVLVCSFCRTDRCGAHPCMQLDVAAETTRQQLLEAKVRVEGKAAYQSKCLEEINDALTALSEQEARMLAKLEGQRDLVRKHTDEAFSHAAERLRASVRESKKQLEVLVDETETRQAVFANLAKYVEAILCDSANLELLLGKRHVEEKLVEVTQPKIVPPCLEQLVLTPSFARAEDALLLLPRLFDVTFSVYKKEPPRIRSPLTVLPTRVRPAVTSVAFTQPAQVVAHGELQSEPAVAPFAEPTTAMATTLQVAPLNSMWRKLCDIDTGRSCVRSIAFNINGKLLAACDDGLKVAVREGVSDTLLTCDATLVTVADNGLIILVLKTKKELRCYCQNSDGELKQLWRKSLPFKFFGALSVTALGDKVVLLIDWSLSIYRLSDGGHIRVLKKAVDGTMLFSNPCGVALSQSGHIIMTEFHGNSVRAVDDLGVTLWQHLEGSEERTEYYGICIDSQDDVYVTDSLNNRVMLFSSQGDLVGQVSISREGVLCPTHVSVYRRTLAVCHTSVHRISIFRLSESRV